MHSDRLNIDGDSKVIRFPPRMGLSRAAFRQKAPLGKSGLDDCPVADLTKYEFPDRDDDYRHRMIVNVFAFAYAILLIIAGVWIASMMAHIGSGSIHQATQLLQTILRSPS